MAKFVFLNGLGVKCWTPAFWPGFFVSIFSIAGWIKLFCNMDLVCFVWVRWSWGLTCNFAGVFERLLCKRFILCCLRDYFERGWEEKVKGIPKGL